MKAHSLDKHKTELNKHKLITEMLFWKHNILSVFDWHMLMWDGGGCECRHCSGSDWSLLVFKSKADEVQGCIVWTRLAAIIIFSHLFLWKLMRIYQLKDIISFTHFCSSPSYAFDNKERKKDWGGSKRPKLPRFCTQCNIIADELYQKLKLF